MKINRKTASETSVQIGQQIRTQSTTARDGGIVCTGRSQLNVAINQKHANSPGPLPVTFCSCPRNFPASTTRCRRTSSPTYSPASTISWRESSRFYNRRRRTWHWRLWFPWSFSCSISYSLKSKTVEPATYGVVIVRTNRCSFDTIVVVVKKLVKYKRSSKFGLNTRVRKIFILHGNSVQKNKTDKYKTRVL